MMVKSLRVQIIEARDVGIPVEHVHRTGEVRFIGLDTSIRVNSRRKDGTPEVAKLIERTKGTK